MASPEQNQKDPNDQAGEEGGNKVQDIESKWKWWPEMPHWRDKGWFFIYYPGFFVMIIFCCIYIFANPDKVVWFGKVDFNPRLFATKEEAEASNAEDIENVHLTFKLWFIFCMVNLIVMIAIGIPRHCNKRYENRGIIPYAYYFFAVVWLAMWAVGLHLRFQEAGRAVCNDDDYCDPIAEVDVSADGSTEPCVPTMLYDYENKLI